MNVMTRLSAPESTPAPLEDYPALLRMIERLHRLLLDTIKDEFERLGRAELTPVQALLLYNIGPRELSVGELRARGFYQGSNVSYSVNKLTRAGYLAQVPCAADRRSVRVSLTEKGHEVAEIVHTLFARHARDLPGEAGVAATGVSDLVTTLSALEGYWTRSIRHIY